MSKQAAVNNNPACVRWINCWSDRFNEYKSDWSRDRYNVELNFSVLYFGWPNQGPASRLWTKLHSIDFDSNSHQSNLNKYLYFFTGFAGLWGLVNNAGILHYLPIEWTPLDVFKRTADVNLWGMIDVTKTFLPLVKKARGRVVNFSSIVGKWRCIELRDSKASTECNFEVGEN